MTPQPSPIRIAEGLLLCAVAFGPLAFGGVEPWSLGILSLLISGATLACAYHGLAVPALAVQRPLLVAVLALIGIGVLQWVNPRSLLEPSVWLPSTISAYATGRALSTWLTYAAVILCASQILDGPSAVRRLLTTLFVLGCALAVVGIIQTAQNPHLIYGLRSAPYPVEPFGPYYNRDHAASLLVMSMLCGLGLFWDLALARERSGKRTDHFDVAAIQTLIIFGLVVTSCALLLTRSLGAIAALLATALVVGVRAFWGRLGRLTLLASAVALAPIAISRVPISRKVTHHVSVPLADKLSIAHARKALADRMVLYRGGLEIIADYPFFGTGLGTLQQAYYPYQPRTLRGLLEHLHCDWLELTVQAGLVGFLAYAFGLLLFLGSCVVSLSRADKRQAAGLAVGAGGAILSFLIHGLIDFSFQIPANAVVFLVLLGAMGALAKSGQKAGGARPPSRPLDAAVGLAALLLIASYVRPALASWQYLRMTNDFPASDTGPLVKAVRLDPRPRYLYELARHQASLIPGDPAGRVAHLRGALARSEAALSIDPANPRFRYLQGFLLWSLGRAKDGQAEIEAGAHR